MRVALLSSSLSKKGGGVAEVALQLGQNLRTLPNVEVVAFGLHDSEIQNDIFKWKPISTTIVPTKGPDFFGYAPGLISAIKKSHAQLIHLHGLWQYPSLACNKSNLPYITTIHGMLDKWAIKNSKLKKQIAGVLYENAALAKAACLQAFTIQEYNDIRKYGLKNPVCIIPNGIDIPEDLSALRKKDAPWQKLVDPEQSVILYLGRIHPKKGLENLIKGWHKSAYGSSGRKWNLIIAGWDQNGYEKQLKELVGKLGIQHSVHFIGPQFNTNKQLAFAHADGFILPSFSEGLPMAILEAWSFQVPVIMTKYCNLPEGFISGSAIEIDTSVESISQGLSNFFLLGDQERRSMGYSGEKLVSDSYNWNIVANKMVSVYNWILNKGQTPAHIILD